MRWLGVLALFAACAAACTPQAAAGAQLVLDIPNGPLDPKGFSDIEVVIHPVAGKDVTLTRLITSDGQFDLGELEPVATSSIEVTLRNAGRAIVGYGRTAEPAELGSDAQIIVPVRRPIVYIAGTVGSDDDNDPETLEHWTEAPATFYDLSTGASLDGKTTVGTTQAVMMIAAGPSLYMVLQATSDPNGALVGPAKVVPVSASDHQAGVALAGSMMGAVLDGAGSEDGSMLVIGASNQLVMVDTVSGAMTKLADGSFARVAIVTTEVAPGVREIDAIAVKNRGSTTAACSTQAELWWATLTGDGPHTAHKVATGGFSDVATDRGAAYYVDACKGELGKVTTDQIAAVRTIAGATMTSRATALAVSDGQAFVGVEAAPATTSLLVMAADTSDDDPRVLWTELAQQVLQATDFDGVQRQLDATSATVDHLEIGAGGRFAALTTSAQFDGKAVTKANFPDMNIETEELRVFDATSGAAVQRYRSWCDGVLGIAQGDIDSWACASTTGQAAAADSFDHRIASMTFLFGKK
jgi:hypothetical protein